MIISIDCWGTLLKGSPTFPAAKRELVKKYFPNLPNDYIDECFAKTKQVFNDVTECSGGHQPPIRSIYVYLLSKLNGAYDSHKYCNAFMQEYCDLAIEHSPEIYCDDTARYLEALSNMGSVVLSCNTMLISGPALERIFMKLGIKRFFNYMLFGDVEGYAKPHRYMYQNSKYHIGDNWTTDYVGAELARSKPILINSTNQTIRDAYNFIVKQQPV